MKFPNKCRFSRKPTQSTVNLLFVAGKEELPPRVGQFCDRVPGEQRYRQTNRCRNCETDKSLLYINTM